MSYYERNLPHRLPEGKNLFVTWRLYGSLPAIIVDTLHETKDLKNGKRFRFIDRELDGAWVRNATSFEKIRIYIERNPVSAGLAKTPEEWPWSRALK